MNWYFLKRLFGILPLLAVLSVILFFLTAIHPIELPLQSNTSIEQYEQMVMSEGKRLHIDKPLFFFSLPPSSWADTLSTIPYSSIYHNIKTMCIHFGGGQQAIAHRYALLKLHRQLSGDTTALGNLHGHLKQRIALLLRAESDGKIREIWNDIQPVLNNTALPSTYRLKLASLGNAWKDAEGFHLTNLLPSFRWNGSNNQYWDWIALHFNKTALRSSVDSRPITQKIWFALRWTLFISISSVLIILSISIPLGLYLGSTPSRWLSKRVTSLLFALYSIPDFWLATILIVLFTTKTYCEKCDIFPVPGMLYIEEGGFASTVLQHWSYFILPFIVTTVDAIAYLANQIQTTTQQELQKGYVTHAVSRGLPRKTILWKHVAPNALFPLLLLIADIIPGLVTGTLIVEVIFNIPGMGRLLYESVLTSDIPVIRDILLLTGAMTFIGYILADWVLSKVHPNTHLSTF